MIHPLPREERSLPLERQLRNVLCLGCDSIDIQDLQVQAQAGFGMTSVLPRELQESAGMSQNYSNHAWGRP